MTTSSVLCPVVLAGGSGTRLWPLSRELYPKQFLPLTGEKTMLQHVLERVGDLPHDPPIILCNHEYRFIVTEQCRQSDMEPQAVILEPERRNTAPAAALAALHATREGDDPLMLVLPADNLIASAEGFRAAVESALPFAEAGTSCCLESNRCGPIRHTDTFCPARRWSPAAMSPRSKLC